MEIKEKILKVYQKYGITVGEEMLEYIANTPERAEGMMRLYKTEEIDSINYIFGKPEENKIFTKFELEAVSRIDLFNRTVVNACKTIWENRNNEENLDLFLACLKEGVN